MAGLQPGWTRGQEFMRYIPATVVIIALWVLVFLATILAPNTIGPLLAFTPIRFPAALLGLITYPLLIGGSGDIINLFIVSFMLYQFGGSLERSWSTRPYVLFLLASNIAAAVLWTIGLSLFGQIPILGGPWLMISTVIVAWAWVNPEETILFMFVLPMKARWIGWLDIAVLFFLFPHSQRVGGWPIFILGFFALGGVAVAIGYDWFRRTWGWIPRRRGSKPARRIIRHPSSTLLGVLLRPYREWQRRRRITKLERTFRFNDDEKRKGK